MKSARKGEAIIMEQDKYCIIESVDLENDEPSIDEVIKVFYNDKYINKYCKSIDKDKIYPLDEAKEILKKNSSYGFVVSTRNDYNKGADMIEVLAYLEERADLNFEVLNWNSMDDYIKEIQGQGYITEKLSEEEFNRWLERKYHKK